MKKVAAAAAKVTIAQTNSNHVKKKKCLKKGKTLKKKRKMLFS